MIWMVSTGFAPEQLAEALTSLGAAGLMGGMWLWERRTSRAREQQLDEAHARILGDRLQLEALLDTVRDSTEALVRLAASQDQLLRSLRKGDA